MYPDMFFPFQVVRGSVAAVFVMGTQNDTSLDSVTANLFSKVFGNVSICFVLRNCA